MSPEIFDGLFNRPPEVSATCPEESLTKQEFVDECDINIMMARYQVTGVPPEVAVGRYGDFVGAPDFLEAQNMLVAARQQFDSLPSSVRDRFANDPARFLTFIHDEKNLDEAEKLGLLSVEANARRDAARAAEVARVKALEEAARGPQGPSASSQASK